MPGYWILDGHAAVPCVDLRAWSSFFAEVDRRRVARETVFPGVDVSTVFLGLDHRFVDEGPPLLFETLVFGGPLDGEMVRTSTWDEAEIAHRAMVAMVKGAES